MMGEKFNYSISAGVNNNIFTTIENKTYNFTYFRPQVKLGYFINESSDLMFNYEVNTENPSVSSLTYNPYFKDPNYIFAGNPNLTPSNNHDFSLSYFIVGDSNRLLNITQSIFSLNAVFTLAKQ